MKNVVNLVKPCLVEPRDNKINYADKKVEAAMEASIKGVLFRGSVMRGVRGLYCGTDTYFAGGAHLFA